MAFKIKLHGKRTGLDYKPVLYLSDKLYIPQDLIEEEDVKKAYDRHVFNQSMCNKCEVYKNGERFSDLCSTCDGFKGRFKTYKEVEVDNGDFYAVPAGDLISVEKNLGLELENYKIEDKRSDVKAKYPLRFTGKLYDGTEIINKVRMANQRQIVKDFFEHKRGLIQSPPRTGKTVLGVFILCKYKRRTLVVAHEYQLLRQYYKTLLRFTNLKELRKETGKKIAGIIKNEKDWKEDLDVVLITYQKFIHAKGMKRLRKYVIGKFGLLEIDECHRSNATAYINLVSKLDMKYKIGLSATMNRKDRLEFLMFQMLGNVVSKGTSRAEIPRVKIIHTGLRPNREWRGRAAYVYANRWLSLNKERNKILVKNIFQDLRENPKRNIVIPVLFVDQVRRLTKLINQQAVFNNENRGENWSTELAQEYYNKVNTNEALKRAREGGDTRVTVAIRKMIKEGIDVPAWSIMYLSFPMNNHEDFYQMTQRICTPYEGKPEPVIKIFVDGMGLSYNCFVPTFQRDVIHYEYNVDEANRVLAYQLMQKSSHGRWELKKEYYNEPW